jgi:hypothetical protein
MTARALVIACGAIAKELVQIKRVNHWDHMEIQCLPAELHNRPDTIPGAVAAKLEQAREQFDKVFVAYADCGTGGALDRLLQPLGIERLPGAHCYEFFAGSDVFRQLTEEQVGSFYLTDFLVRHFDRLVIQGLGLDRHPQLRDAYFGNYRRLVYLAQDRSTELEGQARLQAEYLQLEFEYRFTGLQPFAAALAGASA